MSRLLEEPENFGKGNDMTKPKPSSTTKKQNAKMSGAEGKRSFQNQGQIHVDTVFTQKKQSIITLFLQIKISINC